MAFARPSGTGLLVLGLFVVSIFLSLLLLRRLRNHVELNFDGEFLLFVGVFRRRFIEQPWRAVTATVDMGASNEHRWLLLDQRGRAVLALNLGNWNRQELDALSRRMGLEPEVDPAPRRPGDLRRFYPGAMPWVFAHPVLFTLLLIFGGSFIWLIIRESATALM